MFDVGVGGTMVTSGRVSASPSAGCSGSTTATSSTSGTSAEVTSLSSPKAESWRVKGGNRVGGEAGRDEGSGGDKGGVVGSAFSESAPSEDLGRPAAGSSVGAGWIASTGSSTKSHGRGTSAAGISLDRRCMSKR